MNICKEVCPINVGESGYLMLGEVPDIVCPFCGENDFDFIGLKSHLEHGDCEKYNNTERQVRLF